jgi:hypothetical protein
MKTLNTIMILCAVAVIIAGFVATKPNLVMRLLYGPRLIRTATVMVVDPDAPVPVSVTLYLREDGSVTWRAQP